MDILVKAVDATHPDSAKDARGCYKLGMPVVIKPTGWAWGYEETRAPIDGGKFVIIRVLKNDDTPVWSEGEDPPARVERYMQSERSDLVFEPDNPTLGVVVRRRQYKLRLADIPGGVLSTLNQTGLYEVRWTVLRDYLRDLKSGLDETTADLTVA